MGLTEQEFREKVGLAQSGDADALRDAAHEYVRFIAWVVNRNKKLWQDRVTRPEADSEGFDGLIRAIKTFDLGRKARFSTWAYWSIVNSLKTATRREERRLAIITPHEYRDTADDEDSVPLLAEASIDLKKLEGVLADWKRSRRRRRYAEILELAFGIDARGPLGYHEIGPIMGVGRERVRFMADRAFGWICDEFGVQRRTSLHKARSSNC